MFDAVIVGGGPAGCNAAITLARLNHRVLLLEAGIYPRPKVCGEFLSPESIVFFTESGFLGELRKLKPVPIQTLRITEPAGHQWSSKLPAPALGLSRFALDKAMADYARAVGVEVQDGTQVKQIEGNLRAGFSITTQTRMRSQVFRTATVIAAHGRHSNLDRTLRPVGSRLSSKHYLGLKQHFMGPKFWGHIDLHVFHGGYCGMSQVEDGTTNVCLLVDQKVFQAVTSTGHNPIAGFINWMSGQNPHLKKWLAQSSPVYPEWLSTAQISLETKLPVESDILFAGDAAGMIAPLAGDGMAMALQSGKLAALSLNRYLTRVQDASAMKRNYIYLWQRTFAARLKLGRLLQSIMLRPKLLAPALCLINRFPFAGNWLVQHTRDRQLIEQKL